MFLLRRCPSSHVILMLPATHGVCPQRSLLLILPLGAIFTWGLQGSAWSSLKYACMLTKLPACKPTGSESPEPKTISLDGAKGQVQPWFQIPLEQKSTGATSPCLQWDLWQSAQVSALPAHVCAHKVFRTHDHPSRAPLWVH